MNNTNYFEKYLKYKNKYVELKKISGGNPNTKNIILVGTHGFRIKCLFATLIHLSGIQNFTLHSFKNCAIIRCYSDNTHIRFENIYNGQRSAQKENKDRILYYQNKDKDKIKQISLLKSQFPKFDIPINIEIFLIRHGEGIHNVLNVNTHINYPNKLIDAPLNEEGKQQASRAADIFFQYFNNKRLQGDLKEHNLKLIFCASDLDRPRETVKFFMDKFKSSNIQNSLLKIDYQIHVLPCIHEIYPAEIKKDVKLSPTNNLLQTVTMNNNTFCERDNSMESGQSYANLSSCATSKYHNPIQQNPKCGNVGNYKVNWSYYKQTKLTRDNCANTNLFEQIRNFIKYYPTTISNIPQQSFNRNIQRHI